MNYQQGYEDGVRATKAEYLKLLEEESYPVKELTDEEIDNLIMDVAEKPTDEDLYDFARAILKRASEK